MSSDRRLRRSLIHLRPDAGVAHISRGRSVLLSGQRGTIEGDGHGLLVHEARVISRWRYLVSGSPPSPVALSNVEQHSWLGYYIIVPPGVDPGPEDHGSGQVKASSQHSLEVRVSRVVGEGLHEDIDLTNFTQFASRFELAVECDADFADQHEMGQERRQRGEISRQWQQGAGGAWDLRFDYRAEHAFDHQGHRGLARLDRGLILEVRRASSPPRWERGALRFDVALGPHEGWHACLLAVPVVEGRRLQTPLHCRAFAARPDDRERLRAASLARSAEVASAESDTMAPVVIGAIDRARSDLAALRLYDLDVDDETWTMAAGVPLYVALFGRDSLTAAGQSVWLNPGALRGTLFELARSQGTRIDDWRDEQPGRMLHEAHDGPLDVLEFEPRRRYYGSVTSSPFYVFSLSELWHWTGDRELLWRCLDPALKALRWLDEYGDCDGDGLYEYKTRSDQGIKNQSWKDSGDAIVDEDGRQVDTPIASCEEQCFAYVAKLHFSEILWWLGRKDEARRVFREASELSKRFTEAFWNDRDGFLAMALDRDKRQVRSIASDPGHAIATGILDRSLVDRTAQRLMEPDLFSGWGVRTLSREHPAYNPYSYHRGSVWPVEQGAFALGFARYGLHDLTHRLARAQFDTTALFESFRLPEVFSGHQRDADHPFPALYPKSNSLQAWSASAVLALLQALLGLYAYAPLDALVVDPHLPEWLPTVTLRDLRVGRATVTIEFARGADGGTRHRVLEQRGRLHVLRQPSPWSLTATFAERVQDLLTGLVPG